MSGAEMASVLLCRGRIAIEPWIHELRCQELAIQGVPCMRSAIEGPIRHCSVEISDAPRFLKTYPSQSSCRCGRAPGMGYSDTRANSAYLSHRTLSNRLPSRVSISHCSVEFSDAVKTSKAIRPQASC